MENQILDDVGNKNSTKSYNKSGWFLLSAIVFLISACIIAIITLHTILYYYVAFLLFVLGMLFNFSGLGYAIHSIITKEENKKKKYIFLICNVGLAFIFIYLCTTLYSTYTMLRIYGN